MFILVSAPLGVASRTWGWWLLQIGTPLIVLIGIPGNILSFIVMKSPRFRYKSYSHYLCALAVFDTLVLVVKYLKRVDDLMHITQGHGFLHGYTDAGCKIHNFTEHVCYLMSSWVVLCMTLERFIAVNFPFKKDLLCRPRNAVTIILVVFAVMSYSQIFRLIIIEKDEKDSLCIAPTRYLHIYVVMHIYMYQLVLQFMLPAILILVCNLTILWKIRRLQYMVAKHGTNHSVRAYAKRHKTTCTLLLISFTYIVTLLPLVLLSMIMYVAVRVNPVLAMWMYRNADSVRHVFELLSEINYGINFYIYIMSGAQFRCELRAILFRQHSLMSSGGPTEKLHVFHFRKSMSTV